MLAYYQRINLKILNKIFKKYSQYHRFETFYLNNCLRISINFTLMLRSVYVENFQSMPSSYERSRTKETIRFLERTMDSSSILSFLVSLRFKNYFERNYEKANRESEAGPSSGRQICSGSLFHSNTNFSNNVIAPRSRQISAWKFPCILLNYLCQSRTLHYWKRRT